MNDQAQVRRTYANQFRDFLDPDVSGSCPGRGLFFFEEKGGYHDGDHLRKGGAGGSCFPHGMHKEEEEGWRHRVAALSFVC